MGDGSISVAHGAPANISVGTAVDLFVRVRDRTGRPLKGAVVSFGEAQIPDQTTDETGLAFVPGAVATSFTIIATYTAQFGSKPGSILSSQARTFSNTMAFDPSPRGAPDPKVRHELHATIQVPVRYPLKRLFGWQSPTLREKMYIDGISVGSFKAAHPEDHPERNRLLRLKGALGHIDASVAELAAAQKRVDDLRQDIETQKKQLVKDESQHEKDNANVVKHDEKVEAENARLSDAARAKRQKRDADMHASLQKKVDRDDAAREAHLAKLKETEARLEAASEALEAAQESHGGSTHREMMEYLVDEVLPDSGLADWIKYGIIHLTGLRYRPSSGCYYPPGPMVYGLREKEIDEREHPSQSAKPAGEFAKIQRTYAREYLAILKGNAELSKSAAQFYAKQLGTVLAGLQRRDRHTKPEMKLPAKPSKEEQLIERLEQLARSDGPWVAQPPDPAVKGNAKATELYHLRAIASAVCQAWLMGVEAARAGGTPKGPPDENELLGEIADRFFQKQIPEIVWNQACRSTQLLHDFASSDLDAAPQHWNVPATGGVPSNSKQQKGKEPADPWARVFTGSDSDWLRHHKETMQPYITGVVCNDVASTLARARGLPIGDGEYIMPIAAAVLKYGKTVAENRAKEAAAAAAAPAPAPDAADAGEDAATEPPIVGLFRPQMVSDIQVGDLIFFGTWAAEDSDEAHLIPPHTIVDLGPSVGTKDPSQFGAALKGGIMDIKELTSLDPKGDSIVFGVQRERGGPKDRIVRAWKGDSPPKVKKGAKPPEGPPYTHYEQLIYHHISTVIAVKARTVLVLETAKPVGINERKWEDLSMAENFFGRMTPENPPDLSWFLNRDNLLSKGRLDDG